MYPSLLAIQPDVAESIVEYRRKTRPGARANAERARLPGTLSTRGTAPATATFEECHSVDPPHCQTQIHLQGDIALATWQYYLATGDSAWLRAHGGRCCRASPSSGPAGSPRNADGSYSINNVAGPDEYTNGVNDGVFTNAGAATALRDATKAAQMLGETAPAAGRRSPTGCGSRSTQTGRCSSSTTATTGTRQIKQADTVLLIYPLEWPMTQTRRRRTRWTTTPSAPTRKAPR